MQRKTLFFLLTSLCTTQINACDDLAQAAGCAAIATAPIAAIMPPIAAYLGAFATIAALKIGPRSKMVRKSKKILTELHALQKIEQKKSLTPEEKAIKQKAIHDFNKLFNLKTKDEWTEIVYNQLSYYKKNVLQKKRSLSNSKPIEKILKRLYELDNIALIKGLTKAQQQEINEHLATLQSMLHITLTIDASTDLKTLHDIAIKHWKHTSRKILSYFIGTTIGLTILCIAGSSCTACCCCCCCCIAFM